MEIEIHFMLKHYIEVQCYPQMWNIYRRDQPVVQTTPYQGVAKMSKNISLWYLIISFRRFTNAISHINIIKSKVYAYLESKAFYSYEEFLRKMTIRVGIFNSLMVVSNVIYLFPIFTVTQVIVFICNDVVIMNINLQLDCTFSSLKKVLILIIIITQKQFINDTGLMFILHELPIHFESIKISIF